MSSEGNLQLHYNDTVMGFGPQWQDCRSCGVFSPPLFFLRADFEDCLTEPGCLGVTCTSGRSVLARFELDVEYMGQLALASSLWLVAK